MGSMNISEEFKRKILALVEHGAASFTDIKKNLRIESNQLAYHLNNLVENKFLSKTKKGYALTETGKNLMPYMRYSREYDLLPMISVGVFIMRNNKVLLLKRAWEPFKDQYLGVSGKLKRFEDVFEAAKKRTRELVGVDLKKMELFCINNFVSQTNHFLMFFFKATTDDKPEQGEWFGINDLPAEIFPETKYVLEQIIGAKGIKYMSSFYDDKTQKFKVIR
jgi:ADP-ribose pyrophosphatase YjhB (NUDIX family)